MKEMLLVGLGGFLGSVFRYAMGGFVQRLFPMAEFPYGTLAVNILGCFLIGLLAGLAEARDVFSLNLRLFVFVGILGGFTTFSTFGFEAFALIRDGAALKALASVLVHVVIGLVAVWAGYTLSRHGLA